MRSSPVATQHFAATNRRANRSSTKIFPAFFSGATKKFALGQPCIYFPPAQNQIMLHRLNDLLPRSAVPKSAPRLRETPAPSSALPRNAGERKPTYAKVFRWQLPADQTVAPKTVELIGSFTDWQRVPLRQDDGRDSWETTVPDIAGHRTHHYMLLVDGRPAPDKNCDGLAIPVGPEEQQYALTTPRGPRLFMLFAQTK